MFDVLFENDDLLVIDKPTNVALLADRSDTACLWALSLPEIIAVGKNGGTTLMKRTHF